TTLEGIRHGQSVRIVSSFVVDASGPRGLLSRAFDLEAPSCRWLPATQGLYTHFENVRRWDALRPDAARPFPADDAAVHHVFPGGWIWMLRFNNGITSVGAALTDEAISRLGPISATDGAGWWAGLLAMLPAVREQLAEARAVRPWIHAPRLAF